MLSIKWFLFLFMAFGLCSLLSGVISGGMGEPLPWESLTATYEEVYNFGDFIVKVPALAGDVMGAIWNMFAWNYTFLEGEPWIWVKMFVFAPISAAFAVTIMITFIGIARGSGT